MDELRDYVEDKLSGIEEVYEYYLEKLDHTYKSEEIEELMNKIRELRTQKNLLEEIKEKIDAYWKKILMKQYV